MSKKRLQGDELEVVSNVAERSVGAYRDWKLRMRARSQRGRRRCGSQRKR